MKTTSLNSRAIRAISQVTLLALATTSAQSAMMDLREISVDPGSTPPHSVFVETGKSGAVEGWMALAPAAGGTRGSWDSAAGTLSFEANIYGTAAEASDHKNSGIVGKATASGTGIIGKSSSGGGQASSPGSIEWTVTGAKGTLLNFLKANFQDTDPGPSTSFVFSTSVLSEYYPSQAGQSSSQGSHGAKNELTISRAQESHGTGHGKEPIGVEIDLELEDMVPVPEASTTLAGFAAGGMLLIHLVRTRRASLPQAR